MSRRNLCLWAATGTIALLVIGFAVWQRTHAAWPCGSHRGGYGKLVGAAGTQIEERFGRPNSIGGATLLGEGEVWEYDSVYWEPGAVRPTPLFVHFDTHGRVSRICTFDGGKLE